MFSIRSVEQKRPEVLFLSPIAAQILATKPSSFYSSLFAVSNASEHFSKALLYVNSAATCPLPGGL